MSHTDIAANLPTIDWRDFELRYDENPKLGKDILSTFINELPKSIEAINASLMKHDYHQLQAQVHQLHGAACYACVPKLKAILNQLEGAIKQNEPTTIHSMYKQLAQEQQHIETQYHDQ